MSLTTFLKNQEVRDRFAQQFPKPKFDLKGELLAPPQTKRYALIGTAFDYLLRFYLKRLNPDAVTRIWVAESVLEHPFSPLLEDAVIHADTGEILSFTETDLTRKVQEIIEQAKAVHTSYLSSGEITDKVLESTLLLAQLDPIYRSGYIDENIGTVYKEDITDLRNLISIVNPEMFRAKESCILNPTFGNASRLVGGADADLLIDSTLIDIKTTKNLKLIPDDFHQIVGYYILSRIGGMDGAPSGLSIERVGIYYSRYGVLYTVPLNTVVSEDSLPSFMEWLTEKATSMYHQPRRGGM